MPLPLRARPIYRIAHDASRVVYLTTHVDGVHGGRLRLTIVNPGGDTLVDREYPFVGEPIPERVRDSVVARALATTRSANPQHNAEWRALAPKRTQPVWPPVQSIIVGRDETIWLGIRATGALRTWIALDGAGTPIGTLQLPAAAELHVAERATLWGIIEDADDLPSVVRYRVDGWH
jgi:hypothetical protein